MADGLKIDAAQAQAHVGSLAAAGLVQDPADGSPMRLTAVGEQVYGQIRAAVAQVTRRLWDDLPAEDLATAGRVLSIITERASAELAAT